jgi:hypothetical protein
MNLDGLAKEHIKECVEGTAQFLLVTYNEHLLVLTVLCNPLLSMDSPHDLFIIDGCHLMKKYWLLS